jgi:hypothetical protein
MGTSANMSNQVAARRLEILAAAQASGQGFLRFEPGRLRFSLGTSLADLSVPVEVAPDAQAILHSAAVEVALLLVHHHRRLVPAEEHDRLLLREDHAGLPVVEPTFGSSVGGPDLRAAAALAAAAHPSLTASLAAAWLGKGGKGRSLVGLWIELLRRAFEEQASAHGEETALIVTLALAAETAAAEQVVREALPATHADRWLRAGAMTALWTAASTGLQRAFRDAGLPAADPSRSRLEAALSPTVLLGGRVGVQASGATVYGCELSVGVPRADELVTRLSAGLTAAALPRELGAILGGDDTVAVKAEQAVAIARLRDLLTLAVLHAEAQGQGARVAAIRELLGTPGGLAAGAADTSPRQALSRQLAACSPGGDTGALVDRAVRALQGWRPREPGAVFGLAREAARAEYALAAAALCADLILERMAAGATRALTFRTGREAEGGAEGEYEAGRLYRLSARPGRLLKATAKLPVAHLFADVKDFTRRTALLGQAPMAEFLRREFYLPILVAAKAHYGGMQHLADRGGVSLNNLLGDAISFSGEIEAMLQLAVSIRQAFAAYSARLQRQIDDAAVRRQLEELERQQAASLRQAERARGEAEAALAQATLGTPAHSALATQVTRLAAAERWAAAERQRAMARARGEGLEAGVFISHGDAPLVVMIEDEVFGHNRVAIAEKINESARGTARAALARVRADAQLAAARAARGRPRMAHAWSVFIDRPLALTVAPDIEAQAVAAARAGDLAGAMRWLSGPVRERLEAAVNEEADPPGDIYNSGAALSEEALTAFLAEVRDRRVIRRIELDPADVPEEASADWFYGAERQSLVICFHPDGRVGELFRRVGRAAFKGLGGVTVWELCAEQDGPALLVRLLGRSWSR